MRLPPQAALALVALARPSLAGSLELPVQERVLQNGLKALVLPDQGIPNAVIYVGWRVGSKNERPGITGLAHFFEHMMFSGGPRYGAGRFDPVMEANGGASNAYTTRDVTCYQDWFPAARLPLMLDMEADRIGSMKFVPELVETERGVVASERRLSMEDPTEVMREQLWAAAYVAHPYQWDVLGWMVDIENWRQEDLEQFFRAHYSPQHAVLVIVGAVDPEHTFALIEEKLGSIPRGPERRPVHTAEPPQRGERRVTVEHAHAQLPQVMAAWHIPASQNPDFAALEVLEQVLLGGESSRLHRALVDEAQVCLEVGGGYQGLTTDPGLFVFEGVLREGQAPARAEELCYAELARLGREGPGARELVKAKNSILAGLLRRLRTIDGKADLLLETELFFGGWKQLGARLERVEAVQAADLQRVLLRYFVARNRTVCTLSLVEAEEEAGAEDPDAAGEGPGEGEEGEEGQAGEKPRGALVDVEPPPPAGLSLALPRAQEHVLENGLHLLLVPDREVPLISFQVRVAGGTLEDPPGKEGATELLACLLSRGAGERDAKAFLDAVEEAGGSFSAGASRRWLSVRLELLGRERELGLELLCDALRRPRLEEGELTRERAKAIDALRAAKDEPEQVIGDYWLAWLFRGHPWARPAGGDERTLPGVTLEDVRAAAARALGPARTWIAVAGDFDPAEMKAALERRLGDWRAETPPPPAPAAPPPTKGQERRILLVNKPGALQTYFRLGGVGFTWADPDWPARYLANVVLGGRFTSRLNRALRIESGLTYGAGSGFDDALGGAFAARSYTATPTSREALELADQVYTRLRAEGITAAELASARNYIQGQYGPDTVETAGQVAAMYLALRFDGLGPEQIDGLFARLDALTLEQVNRVIKERFPPAATWVVIGQAEALREVLAPLGAVTEVELSAPGFGPVD